MKQSLLALLLGFSMFGVTSPAVAQDLNPQLLHEAAAFFARLASNTDNPMIAAMARENASKLQESPTKPQRTSQNVEVQLLPQMNNSLAVPAMLNQKVMATFLVDTGATYTVITPRLAQKLGIAVTRETPRIPIITANGYIRAPLVTVDKLTIGSVEVRNVKAVVQDLGNDVLLSGLLGMNFFEGMDLTVKQDRLILSMTR